MNLTHLNLRTNRITDITPLLCLTNLVYLDVGNNRRIRNIPSFAGLTKLKNLPFGTIMVLAEDGTEQMVDGAILQARYIQQN